MWPKVRCENGEVRPEPGWCLQTLFHGAVSSDSCYSQNSGSKINLRYHLVKRNKAECRENHEFCTRKGRAGLARRVACSVDTCGCNISLSSMNSSVGFLCSLVAFHPLCTAAKLASAQHGKNSQANDTRFAL